MYKKNEDNVEVYFICDRKENMGLVETYYDKKTNTHYWYFNAYLSYENYKNNFKDLKIGGLTKSLLMAAASRYLLYRLETGDYKDKEEYNLLVKELKKIKPKINKYTEVDDIIINL